MQAILDGRKIADSDDIVEVGGYIYFRYADVWMEFLEKAEKTESDWQCPHGVQFYDIVIDGVRHKRSAWSYEVPQSMMARTMDRLGFWKDVRIV